MPEQAVEQSKQRAKKLTYNLKGFSILLADDYEFMQSLVVGMLKEFGVGSIMTRNDGSEARDLLTISLAAQQSTAIKGVDLLITDWLMPKGSGIDLISWVRNHKKDQIRFLPILLLSAFTSEDVIVEARNRGANEELVKPISGELLASRILAMINNPRAFIKAPDFFGPDRRRREKEFKGEDRRKTPAEEITQHNEQI